MFIKIMNQQREQILMNADSIESILCQTDGDIFITTKTGKVHKIAGSFEDILKQLENSPK